MRAAQLNFTALAATGEQYFFAGLSGADGAGLFIQLNAFGNKLFANHCDQLRIVIAENMICFNQRDFSAKAAEGLGHFNTDRAAAEDHQKVRHGACCK